MKKRVTTVLIALAMMLSLSACGKFTCDFCGEEKTGKKHVEKIFGEEVVMCDDCYKDIKSIFK